MARSGRNSQLRHSRHNRSSGSQCSDSNPFPTNAGVPVLHRQIPGLVFPTGDGILPIPSAVQRCNEAPSLPGGAQLNHQQQEDSSPHIITIPTHLIQAGHKKLFGNKVVLAFESEYDSRRTLSWLAAFNQESPISLTLSDVLLNSLFVVQFDAALGLETRDLLLQRSPLKALDCFAAVNPYGPVFDPSKDPDFKHLTTVNVLQGSPLIFEYLSFVVSPIGRLIRSNLSPGSESHKISAVIETSLKSFPPLARIHIPPAGVTTIHFDFSHKNVRCLNCLSYAHSTTRCTSAPGPSIIGNLPPPPPLSRPPNLLSTHSQPSPGTHNPSSSASLQELEARAKKDRLEIQYWQSLALSLKKKAHTAKKASTNPIHTTRRKRQPSTSQPASIHVPAPSSSTPIQAPSPSPDRTPIQSELNPPAQNPAPDHIPAPQHHSEGSPSPCPEPSRIPSSIPIPPCIPEGVPDLGLDLLNPRNREHLTLRKRKRRPAASSDTETDPETAALIAVNSRTVSPCQSQSAIPGGPSSNSHGPSHNSHVQCERPSQSSQKTSGETISGQLASSTRHSVLTRAQTAGRTASTSRVGSLERGKLVCGPGH